MNGDRATRIWTAVALHAQRDAVSMSARHACLACAEAIAVNGVGLVLTGSAASLDPVCVTDSRMGELEELQATAGQGPGIDALESGTPVLVDDMASATSTHRWPVFAPGALRLGIRAMFSLPLALGAIRVGVLDLCNDNPRTLDQDQLIDALIYADTALLLVLDMHSGIATPTDGDYLAGSGPVLWHAEVHQAAGMISVQLGIPVLDALARLRAHAYRRDQRLADTARLVVERRLQFRPGDADPVTAHGRAQPVTGDDGEEQQ